MDARVNTVDDPSTSDKKIGELWSSNPSFAGAFSPGGPHVGICHTFLVCLSGFCRSKHSVNALLM